MKVINKGAGMTNKQRELKITRRVISREAVKLGKVVADQQVTLNEARLGLKRINDNDPRKALSIAAENLRAAMYALRVQVEENTAKLNMLRAMIIYVDKMLDEM